MIYGIIYQITNIVNSKVYIGQTISSLHRRMQSHKSASKHKKSKSYIHNAIRKYGWNNFTWEIVCECSSKEELCMKEIETIAYYESHFSTGKGYNLTKGGEYGPTIDPFVKEKALKNLRIVMKNFCGDNNSMANPDTKQKHLESIRYLTKTPEWKLAKQKGDEKQKLSYEVTFPNGTKEIIVGLNEFCKKHNIRQSKMSCVVSGNRKHHKGFTIVRHQLYTE